ncbi:2-C-methyl-D-erythritol 2,4-cyclodiphosphate synthase (Fragment) [Eimeria tenella]|uniref:2-C-methyl-D-erythritol 2,4-cyclodiphosphate synthase n=1 Tax=Eimeria tenella TaxID=5802 RepID=U6KJK7_EIMTE
MTSFTHMLLAAAVLLLQQQWVQRFSCNALSFHRDPSAAAATAAAAATLAATTQLSNVDLLAKPRHCPSVGPQQQQQRLQKQRRSAAAFLGPHAAAAPLQHAASSAFFSGAAVPAAAAAAANASTVNLIGATLVEVAAAPAAAAAAGAAAADLPFRIGHGYDLHRLSTNPKEMTGPLILSGVSFAPEIPAAAGSAEAKQQQSEATAAAAEGAAGEVQRGDSFLSVASSGFRRLLQYSASVASSISSSSSSSKSNKSNLGVGVVAHSDGDVVLHAAADAVFAAAGAADIGQQFPDTAAENKGRNSREFVAAAVAAAAAAGYTVAQVDVTLMLQRPRISSKKQQMIDTLAAALGISSSKVSLKAKTGEGVGPVGRGEAVECHAVALLQRQATDAAPEAAAAAAEAAED